MSYGGHNNIRRPDGNTADAWFSYTCAHCHTDVSGAVVAHSNIDEESASIRWLWCPACGDASVRTVSGHVYPAAPFGPSLEGLPPDVASAYNEARACLSANAFTGTELICRKILIHVAVDRGAKPKSDAGRSPSFAACLDYLKTTGFVTPTMETWVTLIKDHGNEAAHELTIPTVERAKSTLLCTAELLRVVYEMPFLASKYAPTSS